MAGEIVFTAVNDVDYDDQLSILILKTAGGSAVYYTIFKGGRATERTYRGRTLHAELAHTDMRGGESPCKLEVHIYNDNSDKIYIYMKYNLESIGELTAKITREAKQELIQAFTVAPPLDPPTLPPTLPTLNVPQGQEDATTFEPIQEGTVMADFFNSRNRGRYYTRDTYTRLPNSADPYTRQRITANDVQFYIAHLDPTMTAVPTHGARRRKGRKTYRKRRFHTRRA